MSGTIDGGKRAAATNKARFGDDFYRRIALEGQKAWKENGRKPRGFAAMSREKVSEAGKKGGKVSRRGKKKQMD